MVSTGRFDGDGVSMYSHGAHIGSRDYVSWTIVDQGITPWNCVVGVPRLISRGFVGGEVVRKQGDEVCTETENTIKLKY